MLNLRFPIVYVLGELFFFCDYHWKVKNIILKICMPILIFLIFTSQAQLLLSRPDSLERVAYIILCQKYKVGLLVAMVNDVFYIAICYFHIKYYSCKLSIHYFISSQNVIPAKTWIWVLPWLWVLSLIVALHQCWQMYDVPYLASLQINFVLCKYRNK